MRVEYKQIVDFDNYFTPKPSGDAAIDLRIASVDLVKIPWGLFVRGCYDSVNRKSFAECTTEAPTGEEFYSLSPGFVYLVHTGVCLSVPENHVGLLSLRSSSGLSGLSMLNPPGVIDPGYTGELMLPVFSVLDKPLLVGRWMRLAQLTIVQKEKISLNRVPSLVESERGSNGFGSTGVK